jgi:hypothetical protein
VTLLSTPVPRTGFKGKAQPLFDTPPPKVTSAVVDPKNLDVNLGDKSWQEQEPLLVEDLLYVLLVNFIYIRVSMEYTFKRK